MPTRFAKTVWLCYYRSCNGWFRSRITSRLLTRHRHFSRYCDSNTDQMITNHPHCPCAMSANIVQGDCPTKRQPPAQKNEKRKGGEQTRSGAFEAPLTRPCAYCGKGGISMKSHRKTAPITRYKSGRDVRSPFSLSHSPNPEERSCCFMATRIICLSAAQNQQNIAKHYNLNEKSQRCGTAR